MTDPARIRRRIGYPLATLCAAGVIWLFSTGRLSLDRPPDPAVYESFVREAVEGARSGRGQLSGEGLMGATWRRIAPAALRDPSGAAFEVRLVPAQDRSLEVSRDGLAGQAVDVRLPDGAGAVVYVRFMDGAATVVGVGARLPTQGGAPPGGSP